MASLKSALLVEKFIFKLASLLKNHFVMIIGKYLFVTFLEILATYKLVGMAIALLHELIVRRIRANLETELPVLSPSNTARLGTLRLSPVDKVRAVTSASSENG